jgi:hypothetical protein
MAYTTPRKRADIEPDVTEAIVQMNGSMKGFNKAVNSLLRLSLQIQARNSSEASHSTPSTATLSKRDGSPASPRRARH